jgi:hypothetical protein
MMLMLMLMLIPESEINNQQLTINNGERKDGDVGITKREKSMAGGMEGEEERGVDKLRGEVSFPQRRLHSAGRKPGNKVASATSQPLRLLPYLYITETC